MRGQDDAGEDGLGNTPHLVAKAVIEGTAALLDDENELRLLAEKLHYPEWVVRLQVKGVHLVATYAASSLLHNDVDEIAWQFLRLGHLVCEYELLPYIRTGRKCHAAGEDNKIPPAERQRRHEAAKAALAEVQAEKGSYMKKAAIATEAAKLLNISRSQFHKQLNKDYCS